MMPKAVINRAAGNTVLVHVRSNVAGKIRKEKRNGRDVIVVPSATLPDDIIMNGIKYPAAEIQKSFASLNRTPAPLGHPTINGEFVSARDPEGINIGWIGAWNENARQEGGRVLLDKVIDVAVANQTEGGRAVLDAVDKGEPVHTSTGLLCMLDNADEGETAFKYSARDIEFDHDAILLDEDGAATPEQGVGMMVNKKGERQEIEVINSFIEDADRELDWALDSAFHALDRRARVPVMERMKAAMIEAFGFERATSQTQLENDDMTVNEKQFEALSAEVKTLSDSMATIGEQISKAVGNAVSEAVKPLVDAQAEMKANQEAKDKAELDGLVAKIVKANVLDEDSAKELTLNAARALAEKVKNGKAAGLNGAFNPTNAADDEFSDMDLNAGMDTKN